VRFLKTIVERMQLPQHMSKNYFFDLDMDDLDVDINEEYRWGKSNLGMIAAIIGGSVGFILLVACIIWKCIQPRERTFT
jgi:hypothetical protein